MTTNHTTTWNIIKFILTAIGLVVFSAACSVLGVLIARIFTTGTLADLGLAIIGLLFGYIFGTVAGILGIKFFFHQSGSLLFSMAAAIVWIGVTILISVIFNSSNDLVSTIVIVAFFGLPFVALGGFYWKRRKLSS
jgi:hypothetical protein